MVSAYKAYGHALLKKAQNDTDIFGGKVKEAAQQRARQMAEKDGAKKSEEESEEEGEEEKGDAADAKEEGQEKGEAAGDEGGEEGEESEEASEEASEGASEEESEEEGEEGEEGEGAEDDDLDLAWQMFEMARIILEKDASKVRELIEVRMCLVDVQLEREDLDLCLKDLAETLALLNERDADNKEMLCQIHG